MMLVLKPILILLLVAVAINAILNLFGYRRRR
jgi:hypothetical protein